MNGASITLMKLDDELQSLLEHEALCPMFKFWKDNNMKWIGTSWKMNNDLSKTKKYIDILIKNKKILKKKIVIFL